MTTDTTPVLVSIRTGEVIGAARDAETFVLADVVDEIAEKRDELAALEKIALDELLRRLDRRGEWTLRVGDPKAGVVHTITAPSPTAGTTAIRLAQLRDELCRLLDDDKIEMELARKALKRTVTITAEVAGPDVDLDALAERLRGIDAIAGVPVVDVTVATDEKVVQAGVNALKKSGLGDVVDGCTVAVSPPARKAKVKTERRATAD